MFTRYFNDPIATPACMRSRRGNCRIISTRASWSSFTWWQLRSCGWLSYQLISRPWMPYKRHPYWPCSCWSVAHWHYFVYICLRLHLTHILAPYLLNIYIYIYTLILMQKYSLINNYIYFQFVKVIIFAKIICNIIFWYNSNYINFSFSNACYFLRFS